MEELVDRISIRNNCFKALIKGILIKFGHLISRLSVLNGVWVSKNTAKEIFRSINLYCSENLSEFEIHEENDIFVEFTRAFKKVESVSLEGDFNRVDNSKHTFSQVFPAIRNLILYTVEIHNSN